MRENKSDDINQRVCWPPHRKVHMTAETYCIELMFEGECSNALGSCMIVALELAQPIKYGDLASRLPLPRSKLPPHTKSHPTSCTFYNHNNTSTLPHLFTPSF
jgi:hypothetical protein